MMKNHVNPITESHAHDTATLASGLCLNCRVAATCMYVRQRGGAVWHCDEYQEGGAEPVASLVEEVRPEPKVEARAMGLCANCDVRDTCTLPRPQGGVWHCEEYR
jgi:hypothetical protein